MPTNPLNPLADEAFQKQCLGLINITRSVSRDVILPWFRSPSLVVNQKTSAHDLVTAADSEAEVRLAEAISTLMPGATIIGEEAVAARPEIMDGIASHDLTVIIDPIDGTFNYAHGIATFGVAIAVLVKDITVFGLLYDPVFDDTIYAFLGDGAKWIRGKDSEPAKISARDGKAGFVPVTSFPPETAGQIINAGHSFSALKSLGCSSHEYRLLAQGQASWHIGINPKPWDHAAGVLIHTEAGGISRFADGTAYSVSRQDCAVISAPNVTTWAEIAMRFSGLV